MAALLLALAVSQAAANPVTLALLITPFTGGWPAATVAAAVPFATYESNRGPVVFAARVDVTMPLDFAAPPTIGASATGTFTSHDLFQPYFGAGAALGWAGAPNARHLYVAPTVLLGLRVPLNDSWAARLEVSAAPLNASVMVSLGTELALQ